MDLFISMGRAFGALWLSPFYYLSILFVVWQVRKQIVTERRLYSVRLHSIWSETWRTVVWGAAAGLAGTIAFAFVGAVLSPFTLYALWILALLLSVLRIRYLCFAYASGALGLLHAAASYVPEDFLGGGAAPFVRELAAVDMPSVLALVALLHLAEAALVLRLGKRLATPLFFEGKRGKLIGGYRLQGFWPAPMLLLVPAAGGGGSLPWEPLLGGSVWDGGWTVLAFPVVIGFGTMTTKLLPAAAARRGGRRLALYGPAAAVLAALSALAPVPAVAALAAVLVAGLHELVYAAGRIDEAQGSPYYVHDERGLKVLAVLPHSPAADLGIEAGDIVHKVNGLRVNSKAELHAALRVNAAFTKLEVLNLEGQSKFLQRALFANEHHQLGIILCPDDDALYYAEARSGGLFTFLRSRRTKSSSAPASASVLALEAPRGGQGEPKPPATM
ncbi:PDZ domain-containing protein [Paenibacillus thermotolerans]|uniref:PDZ domain-containing protein n=1 Tax=Paenibacillus thermotolerans TaxID=3027807 RepID=UPI0023687558|nr:MULTISPECIES: PDZ domain-containing protein [unclassified Paenibacillus]